MKKNLLIALTLLVVSSCSTVQGYRTYVTFLDPAKPLTERFYKDVYSTNPVHKGVEEEYYAKLAELGFSPKDVLYAKLAATKCGFSEELDDAGVSLGRKIGRKIENDRILSDCRKEKMNSYDLVKYGKKLVKEKKTMAHTYVNFARVLKKSALKKNDKEAIAEANENLKKFQSALTIQNEQLKILDN